MRNKERVRCGYINKCLKSLRLRWHACKPLQAVVMMEVRWRIRDERSAPPRWNDGGERSWLQSYVASELVLIVVKCGVGRSM